jgi:hypothetical protein
MIGAPALYYRSLGTALILLKMGNIPGRPYGLTITVTIYHMYISYIYIMHMENCYNGIVAYFIKLEFITKLT